MSRKKAAGPLGAAGLVAGLVMLAVIAAPGTLSSFVSSADTEAVSISTGEAALSITGSGGSTAGVYPGGPAQLIATRTVTNTGDVPLAVTGAFTAGGALAASVVLTVSVQTAACAATPPATWPSDSGRWQGSAAGLTTSVPVTLSVDAARTLCVWQSLDAAAPNGTQGQAANVTVSLTGTQTAS